jgi:AhpC/TSA family
MNYLAVSVAGASILSLVNLWLIVAMARRLREHSQQLARQAPQRMSRPMVGPPLGTPVPDFSVTTVSGAVISTADLRGGRSLIGFFMPGCRPCHEQIPAFTAFARSLPGGPRHTLAIVANGARPTAGAPGPDSDRLTEELAGADAAQVVRGPSAKAAETALGVTGYPSFILLSADGRVEAGAHGIAGLGGFPALAKSA